jgi:hypothetical protein
VKSTKGILVGVAYFLTFGGTTSRASEASDRKVERLKTQEVASGEDNVDIPLDVEKNINQSDFENATAVQPSTNF